MRYSLQSGATVNGERVRLDEGMAAALCATAPAEFTQHARNPARSVVIPGVRPKRFPAGEYGVPCALIIGQRSARTDRKTSLNDVLREFALPV